MDDRISPSPLYSPPLRFAPDDFVINRETPRDGLGHRRPTPRRRRGAPPPLLPLRVRPSRAAAGRQLPRVRPRRRAQQRRGRRVVARAAGVAGEAVLGGATRAAGAG